MNGIAIYWEERPLGWNLGSQDINFNIEMPITNPQWEIKHIAGYESVEQPG